MSSPLVKAREPRAKMSEENISSDVKKERKKRTKLTDEQKVVMAEKRKATIAAKKVSTESSTTDHKVRKVREKMTDEKKAAMLEKRKATMASKKNAETPTNRPITSIISSTPPQVEKNYVPDAPKKVKRARKIVEKIPEMVLDTEKPSNPSAD